MHIFHNDTGRKAAPRGQDPVLSPVNDEDQDSILYQEIIEGLNRSTFDTSHILVNVQAGNVFLRGAVEDFEDSIKIEEFVGSLSGVNEIRNELQVKA